MSRLVSETNFNNIITQYEYDAAGSRAKTETQDSYTLTRQFDGNGNKTRITYPSARVVDKAYDENNMLLEVRYQGSLVALATYDKNSRLAYAAVGNNTDLSLDYDPDRGRENYRSVTTPYADPLFSVSNMVYDGQNNLTEKTEHSNSSTLNEKLEYDPIDRLTAHNRGAAPAVTWDYDKAGNWTATNQNGTAETRTVTDDNEYNLVGARVPVHDDRGNMTFDGNRSFKYDWSNRLVKITSGSQTLVEYTYDALNRRVTKTVGADTTTYVYDGADVVEAYINGTLARAFVLGGDVDDPILMEYNGQDYYYARDRLGSIRAITDSTGALVESYEYSPFGLMTVFDNQGQDITATGSTIGNPYGYTGRRWDGESGLWYYRNRMYSAELGRFMQRDPAGYVDGLNLYAYVSNNPLRYADPDGLKSISISSNIQNPEESSVIKKASDSISNIRIDSQIVYRETGKHEIHIDYKDETQKALSTIDMLAPVYDLLNQIKKIPGVPLIVPKIQKRTVSVWSQKVETVQITEIDRRSLTELNQLEFPKQNAKTEWFINNNFKHSDKSIFLFLMHPDRVIPVGGNQLNKVFNKVIEYQGAEDTFLIKK